MALNPYDQSVYDAGFKYIPQSQYLLNPFKIPGDGSVENDTFRQPGLPSINIGGGGGGGGFNPYNTDMSKIRQDYNAFPSRQAGEIYSKTFNPRSFDPSGAVADAQRKYNEFQNATYRMPIDTPVGQRQAKYEKDLNEIIMSNRERYGAQGQYDSPYDPIYSSETEAQKFMDNYPEYYGVNEKGIQLPGILGMGQEFLKRIMPINERAIMENEARGAGIFTDDIGRIVTDDYNTAGGIMAGYNLNKIDAGTFDKRRGTIENTLGSKYGLSDAQIEAAKNDPNYTGPGANLINRLGLLDEAEEDILGARKKTKIITKRRKDKKAADAAAKKAEEDKKLQDEINEYNIKQAEIARRSRDSDNDGVPDYVEDAGGSAPGGIYGTDYQGDSSPSNVGGGGGGNPYGGGPGGVQSGMSSSSSPTNVGNPFGYMDGGRVAYMLGGLADLVDIYD